MERLLATPMISPRLPCIKLPLGGEIWAAVSGIGGFSGQKCWNTKVVA
jgi:hypothetical protein